MMVKILFYPLKASESKRYYYIDYLIKQVQHT